MKKIILALFISTVFFSCETTELDLLDDPNNLTINQVNPDLTINKIQLDFRDFMSSFNSWTMGLSRMDHQFGDYSLDANSTILSGAWDNAYSQMFQDMKVTIVRAENDGLNMHAGIAQVLKAYTLVTLVDFFGDVPFTEANNPDFFNPNTDSGSSIYAAAFGIIENAIVNLSVSTAPAPSNDIYYNGDATKWIKLANTLKLKMYLQKRLITEEETEITNGINSLLANPNSLISSSADDFFYQYNESSTPVEGRHPDFENSYINDPAGFTSNYFMSLMKDSANGIDPRIRYYFYRQTLTEPASSLLPCLGNSNFDFCYIGDGYYGRDHADGTFTSLPMGKKTTTWGVYPISGAFDKDEATEVDSLDDDLHGKGAGISPYLMSSFVQFLKAEAILKLSGVSGDTGSALQEGMQQSIDFVMNFGSNFLLSNYDSGFRPSTTEINNYISNVISVYTNASEDEKLNIIMEQYLIALYGNGIEAYNNLRRTGLPHVQSPVFPSGEFPRSNFYPVNSVNSNSNLNQHPVTDRVFWDRNPAGNSFLD